MTPNPRTRPRSVEFKGVFGPPSAGYGLRMTDRARITDCHRIRRWTGLPDLGLLQDLGRFVSGPR
eukprot:14727968-Alexandrium_andersonii.AAC.1